MLGAFALIDEGELDWKVIVIDTQDPKAALLNGMLSLSLSLCFSVCLCCASTDQNIVSKIFTIPHYI